MSQEESKLQEVVQPETLQETQESKTVIPREVPRRRVLEWFAKGAGVLAGTKIFGLPEPKTSDLTPKVDTIPTPDGLSTSEPQSEQTVVQQVHHQDEQAVAEDTNHQEKVENLEIPEESPKSEVSSEQTISNTGTAPTVSESNSEVIEEKLIEIPTNTLILDFAPNQPKEGTTQKIIPPSPDQFVQLLFDGAVSKQKLEEEFGPLFLTNKEAYKKYPREILGYKAMEVYGYHGSAVHNAMKFSLTQLGYKETIEMMPIQQFVDQGSIQFIQDELGNKGFAFTIDHKKVIEGLKSTDQKVVNLSLQFGPVGFIYKEKEPKQLDIPYRETVGPTGETIYLPDGYTQIGVKPGVSGQLVGIYEDEGGKQVYPLTSEEIEVIVRQRQKEIKGKVDELVEPKIEQLPAYTKENAHIHLEKLFEICSAYPDKFFVAAAGNHGDDLRGATNRPPNLLLVQQKGFGDIHGADLAVSNSAIGIPDGSSLSTAIVSTAASVLANRGLPPEGIKKKILELTEVKNQQYKDGNKYPVQVLNLVEAIKFFKAV